MKLPRHYCKLNIFADYNQFYVQDPDLPGLEAPTDWTQADVDDRAKIAQGVVVICPVRNVTVPVEVHIWDDEPHILFNAWQHVIDAPLATRGRIEIHECTGGPLACFRVDPGDYTVRALYRGLDKLSEDGLEGEDFYEIHIWRAPCAKFQVIRRWP